MTIYSIYNLINIELITDKKKYINYFNNEYSRMHKNTQRDDIPTVRVIIAKKIPNEYRYVTRKYCFKRLFTYTYVVDDVDEKITKIYFKSHVMDKIYINAVCVFIQSQLVEPVIYYKLLQENILLMHAAGVSINDQGIMMAAYGGTGKTTFSLKLVSLGYKLLGDDLIPVDSSKGLAFPYPRPLHLFSYNIKTLEGANVPIRYKIIIKLKDILRHLMEKLTREQFLITTRIHAEELYSEDIWSNNVFIKQIILLKKEGDHEYYDTKSENDLAIVLKKIVDSSDLSKSFNENILVDPNQRNYFREIEIEVINKLLVQYDKIYSLNILKNNMMKYINF